MAWIKRNLYFLISSLVAVALLGLAGYYFYANWRLNNDNLEKLNSAYNELKDLANARPNPGNDKISNIDIANQERAQLLGVIEKERAYFKPVPPIPNTTNSVVTKEEFAQRMHTSRAAANRILDPKKPSTLRSLNAAARAVGKRLKISLA